MPRLVILLAVLGGLAACTSQQPRIVGVAPPGISYRFQGDNITETNLRADRYCEQYGRHARLQTVNRSGSDNIAVYECG